MASKDKLLASAQKHLQKGHLAKAIKDYQKLVGLDAGDVRHRQKLAELLSRSDQTEEALEQYQQVAKHYTDRGFYLKAIALFKQMQKLDPDNPDFYHKLAELNRKQGLMGNALAEYRALVAFHEKRNQTTEAIKVLEAMRDLDPENYNIRVKVAESYARHGLHEKALAEFRELVEIFRQKGDLERLFRLQELFIPLFPDTPEIPLGLAETLLRKGEGEQAVSRLKEILAARPDDADVLRLLADGYRQAGDFENERLTVGHLLKIRPEDLDLRHRYLEACLDEGKTEKALEKFEQWRDDLVGSVEPSRLATTCRRLVEAFPERDDLREVLPELDGDEERPGEVAPAPAQPVPPLSADLPEEGGGAPDEEPAEAVVSEPEGKELEDETVPADSSVGESPELGTVEEAEVPLDFLEGMGLAAEETELVSEPVPESEPLPDSVATDGQETAPEEELEPVAGTPPEEPAEEGGREGDAALDLEIDLQIEGEGLEAQEVPETAFEPPESPTAAGEEQAAGPGLAEPEAGSGAVQEVPAETTSPAAKDEEEELDSAAVAAEEEMAEPPVQPAEEGEHRPEADQEAFAGEPPAEEELLELEQEAPDEEGETVELELAEVVEDEESVEEEVYDLEMSEALEEDSAAVEPVESELAAELEEAEFFLQQGLFAEAQRYCETLAERFPESEEVAAKLEAAAAGLEGQNAESQPQEEFFDFGTEVLEEVEEQVGEFLDQADTGGEEDVFSLDGIFSDSQRGVETDIEVGDTESHYNLGIAYKEMGLLDDAVAEFDQAMRSPSRRSDCLTLKGICLAEQGRVEEAEEAFRTALVEPDLPEEQQTSLTYELGLLYQQAGNLEEALKCFQEVASRDHFFREVGERLEELREALGLESGKEGEPAGKDKRDRVSYV